MTIAQSVCSHGHKLQFGDVQQAFNTGDPIKRKEPLVIRMPPDGVPGESRGAWVQLLKIDNGLAQGSKRPKALPKRQSGRIGEEQKEEKDRTNSAVKTLCTWCCTCQTTQMQRQQQEQQPQHPQQCGYNDPLDPRHGKSMACDLVFRSDAVPMDCLAATVMWIFCQPVSVCPGSLGFCPTTCGMT